MAEVISEIFSTVESILSSILSIFEIVNNIFGWMPPWIQDTVNGLLRQLNERMQGFFGKINELLQHVGSPNALQDLADSWVLDVGGPAESGAGSLDPAILPTNGTWISDAYDAYAGRAGKQVDAAQEMKPKTVNIQTSLYDMASAITSFWIQISIAVVAFAIEIGIAIAEICGVLTAPAGIATVLGAVAATVALIATAITEATNMVNTSKTMIQQVQADISASFAFPGGSWPPATAGA